MTRRRCRAFGGSRTVRATRGTRATRATRGLRAAFTLLEVMVALVVSGLVVTLAYATTQAGFDTELRLGEHRDGTERVMAVRALLGDALRHQEEGLRGGDVVFALADRVADDGSAADSLAFLSRGIAAPYGTGVAWRVALWRSHDTLRVEARPTEMRDAGRRDPTARDAYPTASDAAVPLSASLAGVTGVDVQALGRGVTAAWRSQWPEGDVAPDAVALVVQRAGAPSLQLLTRRGLERAP
ncbi:MAG: prepilin-type N-terminal cleavage/methylation domain-containing protein [Gemmatimonadaceae bacterium]|nr:prepilin-type N-terminal cleavage/methylation domain-containing protein [Gemmatimonadaceae bacterium]